MEVCCLMRSRLRLIDVLKMKCLVGFVIVCCWESGGGVQISVKSCKYLLKTLKEVRSELFQFRNKCVIAGGNWTGSNSSLTHTPSVANCIQRLVVMTAVGMAEYIGCGRPSPPWLMDIIDMSCEWSGRSCVCVMCSSMVFIMVENSPLKAPSQQYQLLGRPLVMLVYTSDVNR